MPSSQPHAFTSFSCLHLNLTPDPHPLATDPKKNAKILFIRHRAEDFKTESCETWPSSVDFLDWVKLYYINISILVIAAWTLLRRISEWALKVCAQDSAPTGAAG